MKAFPPLTLIVRQSRPVLSAVALLTWAVWRLLLCDESSPSLLRLLVDWLETTFPRLLLNLLAAATCRLGADDESSTTTLAITMTTIVLHWTSRVLQDVLAMILFVASWRIVYCLRHYSMAEWRYMMEDWAFEWSKTHIPAVATKLNESAEAFCREIDVSLLKKDPHRVKTYTLPQEGVDSTDLYNELQAHAVQENTKWTTGKVSGCVYNDDQQLVELMSRVYGLYAVSNPLHPGYWPKLGQCEGEVIAMTSHLLHGPSPAIGCITSGGTESIVLAIRAHAAHYGRLRGILHPELVCGTTAHAAVWKACEMFGIRVVTIDCCSRNNNSYQLDPDQVQRHITSNTVMIFASAPCYPQGVIDPIGALSDIALRYDIGLHVDACLGGFVLPFCKDAPAFDFVHAGVTSMSADTHKYGLACKGTSVVLYRHAELRHQQYFCLPRWSGGMYVTPTIAGSRAGALSACAWAAMMSIGRQGYEQRVERIVTAAREMAAGIEKIAGLRLLTEKPYMVVCFGAAAATTKTSGSSIDNQESSSLSDDDELNIYRIADVMSSSGWGLACLQSPACVHMCVTLNVAPHVKTFLTDLKKAVDQVRKETKLPPKNNGKNVAKSGGTAGIYGMAGSTPEGPVKYLLDVFTDMTLTP